MLTVKINLSRLKKLELPELANSVITLVEKHDPETLKVTEAFNLLAEKQPLIDFLEVRYGPHPLTHKLVDLRYKRNEFASAITLQMKIVSKTEVDGPGKPVKDTQMIVNRFLLNLRLNNEKEINQKISQFFQKVDSDEELEAALASFNMTAYANELRNAHSSILELADKRYTSISERPRKMTPVYEQSVRSAISHLLRQIDYAKKQYPLIDYSKLIDRLNVELISYENLINTRATLLKKKKAAAEEPVENENDVNNDVIVDEGTEATTATPETTERMMNLDVDDVSESGFGNTTQLNVEKAAAKSSKHVQPPSIDDEDQLNTL